MLIANETIWITGASSGIGLCLLEQLYANSNCIIVSSRSEENLSDLKQRFKNIKTLVFDVTKTDQISASQNKLNALVSKLDRVIINAGDCEYMDPHKPDWAHIQRLCEINYLGCVNTLAVALPLLKKSKHAHIVGINSQAINAPFPRAAGYSASKAAQKSFLDAMRMDLYQFNISVSVIAPGFVDTPLTQKNNFPMPFIMNAPKAARKIITAIEQRKLYYAFPRRLSIMLLIARTFPKLWLNINHEKSAKKS